MDNVKVLFLRGTTIWSKLIRWVTKSEFTHVALVLDEEEKIIIDADGFKVITERKIPSDWEYEIVETNIKVDSVDLYNLCQPYFCLEYDYLNIITQFIGFLTNRFVLIEDKNKFTCVEFVCEILRKLDYQVDVETPIALYKKLKSL